jgi:hypothetical protein
MRFMPLAAHIRHVLDEREEHRRRGSSSTSQDHLKHDAEKTLRATIDLGTYAELLSYDDQTRVLASTAGKQLTQQLSLASGCSWPRPVDLDQGTDQPDNSALGDFTGTAV